MLDKNRHLCYTVPCPMIGRHNGQFVTILSQNKTTGYETPMSNAVRGASAPFFLPLKGNIHEK